MKQQVTYLQLDNTWKVQSSQPINYSVQIKHNLFDKSNSYLADIFSQLKRCLVLIDKDVSYLYRELIETYFHSYHIFTQFNEIHLSETKKNLDTYSVIVDAICQFNPLRYSEPFIVIGGGVLMDIAGFVASTFRRGMPYIRIPTTLIGMVDAAIGIKNGINYGGNKNRLGTFFTSHTTLIDAQFVKSLPIQHIGNGLAEILKMAIIADYELFIWLENYGEKLLNYKFGYAGSGNHELRVHGDLIITRAIDLMLKELAKNLFEHELKRTVDFGHTWSPLIELSTDPPLLHGYAVNVDMAFSCIIARNRGYINQDELTRILLLMQRLGLPIVHSKLTRENAQKALLSAIKHRNGHQNLPMPKGIGNCLFINDLLLEEVELAINHINSTTGELVCEN